MSDPVGIAGDRIRSFVERIEQLETELQETNEQKKEVFSDAKGEGFDVKVIKEIIRLRKQDKRARRAQDPARRLHACNGDRVTGTCARGRRGGCCAHSRSCVGRDW